MAEPIYGPTNPRPSVCGVKKVASVIGLKPEQEHFDRALHANVWSGVLERLRKSNVVNYSIYIAELGGQKYLFSYYDYIGVDYASDMKAIASDPVTQKWWSETDECQVRLPKTPKDEQWLPLESVFSDKFNKAR